MCLTPITLNRPAEEYMPELDDVTFTRVVPCGKCPKCLRNRQDDWVFRLHQEALQSHSAAFITLTYENAPITQNGHETLVKKDFQDFMKRLRNFQKPHHYDDNQLHTIKYFASGEYGTRFLRPHYHFIGFNIPRHLLKNCAKFTEEIWQNGICSIDPSNGATNRYTAKYIMKGRWSPDHDKDSGLLDDRQPEFSLMSKGLGKNFLTPARINYHKQRMVGIIQKPGGYIQKLPRYYKDKIFTRSEKYQLSLEAESVANMNWDEFANHDFKKETAEKIDSIRRFDKNLKLQKLKL